jgi:hypothetical protein
VDGVAEEVLHGIARLDRLVPNAASSHSTGNFICSSPSRNAAGRRGGGAPHTVGGSVCGTLPHPADGFKDHSCLLRSQADLLYWRGGYIRGPSHLAILRLIACPDTFVKALRAILVLAAVFVVAPLQAQTQTAPDESRFGLLAGMNSATLRGSADVDDAGRLTGFVIGVYAIRPLGGLSFRPELLYSNKGAEWSLNEFGESGKLALKLAYLEVPLLLQYNASPSSGLRPHLYAGPAFGYQVGCRFGFSSSGVSASVDCENEDLGDEDFGIERKKFEISAMAGAGLGFGVGRQHATVGLRYQHGFTDVYSDGKAQNRVFSIYGSLEFGRR